MTLTLLLRFLGFVRPTLAMTPEFIAVFEEARSLLDPIDQATAREALADLQADNDAGHARLQAKLAAAQRG